MAPLALHSSSSLASLSTPRSFPSILHSSLPFLPFFSPSLVPSALLILSWTFNAFWKGCSRDCFRHKHSNHGQSPKDWNEGKLTYLVFWNMRDVRSDDEKHILYRDLQSVREGSPYVKLRSEGIKKEEIVTSTESLDIKPAFRAIGMLA